MAISMPKNRSYKTSPYWYPKPVKRKPSTVHEEPIPETLTERLKTEDKQFNRLWNRYWNQRSKWETFEDFLKAA